MSILSLSHVYLYGSEQTEVIPLFKQSLSGWHIKATRKLSIYWSKLTKATLTWRAHTWTGADVYVRVNGNLVHMTALIICWDDVSNMDVTHLLRRGDNEFEVECGVGGFDFEASLVLEGEGITTEFKAPPQPFNWVPWVVGIATAGAIGYATGAFARLAEAIRGIKRRI